MTTLDIQPINIVQCVCKRPKLFTTGGTLAEVLALFVGYELASRAHGACPRDDSPSLTLRWLDEQLGIDLWRPDQSHAAAIVKFQSEAGVIAAMDNFAETLNPKT